MTVIFRMEAPYRGHFELHRLSFGSGSPTVAVVAGLHGNELNSVHAVNLLVAALRVQPPKGTVHLFPMVNTMGAEEGVKRWPFDNRDINRAFPGKVDGDGVQRIAHAIMESTDADICVDVHSGSAQVRELPQVRVPMSGAELEAARMMGLPIVWRRPGARVDTTGLVGAWRQAGRRALHVVGGRGITLDTRLSGMMARGLSRLLAHVGMMPSVGPSETVADVSRPDIEVHRAMCGGFYVSEVRVGDVVQPGHLLGYIQSPLGGERLTELRAACTGVVMTVRAWPMVHAQELLVRVAGTPKS